MAVGLSTIVHGIGSRRDIERNLRIVEDGIHAAVSIIGEADWEQVQSLWPPPAEE